MLWAIAIAFNHSNRVDITVAPFVIVELLVAIGFPVLFYIAGIFMASVLDFITLGAADSRGALPRFLKSIQFEMGDKEDSWIIEDTFYFPLTKRTKEERKKHGFCYSCFPSPATLILVTILGLTISLAVSFFADITIDTQVSVTSCDDVDRDFNCFNKSTLAYVDCDTNRNVELIHCFKFYRFGVDVDIISSIATTFAFYLVARAIFGYTFLKVLLKLSHSLLWGIMFIVLGVILVVGTAAITLTWLAGYVSSSVVVISRLNVISLAQFLMVSMFVLLIGFLMVGSKWVEIRPKKRPKERPKEKEKESYKTSTT